MSKPTTITKDTARLPARSFQVDQLTVELCPDRTALAAEAAHRAAQHLRETLAAQPTAAVILATGQSQLEFLDRLFLDASGVDWKRVIFFHMDEYLGVTEDHPSSFRRYLRERVAGRVKSYAFHYLAGDALEPWKECERYGRLLQAQPIDLCFLGVGDNGHLAFNDPPVANFQDPFPVKVVKLDDICRRQQVSQGQFPSVEAMPAYALSLSIPTLCSARHLLCLAPGGHKAQIIHTMLHGPITPACPASILRHCPQATLFLDPDSARLVL